MFENLNITYEHINIALLCFGLFFVAGGMFWGLVRGLKKTTFRGVWLILTAIVLFFATPLITKLLLNINFSFLNLELDGISFTSVNEFINLYAAKHNYTELITANPVLLEMVEKLTGLLINAFIFVIVFWLLKIILYPIWAIIASVLIKKRDENGEKIKKYRLFGMLEGIVIGLIIGVITLMPLMGTLQTLSKIEQETTGLMSEDSGIVSELAGEELFNIISFINDSNMNQVYTYTGLNALSKGMYTYLTTTKINGETVSLQKEIKNGIVAYKLVTTFTESDFSDLTKQKITELLNNTEQLVDLVFNIGIIKALGNDFLPYIMNGITSGEEFFIKVPSVNNEEQDQLIMQALNELKDINFSDIRGEIKALINIVRVLNENNILLDVKNLLEDEDAEIDLETALALSEMLNENIINSLTTNLFNMKTIAVAAPLALNYGIDYLIQKTEVVTLQDFELNSYTAENLKTLLNGIFNTTLAIINTLDLESEFYVTKLTLPQAGKLIDVIKNFNGLTDENFKLLVNFAESKLDSLLTNAVSDSIPTNIVLNIKSVLANLSEINSYETELEIFENIFEDVLTIYNAVSNADELNLQTVGRILDQIKNTTLFKSEFVSIIKNGIDYATTFVPDDFGDLTAIFNGVKNNVTLTINYEDEMKILNKLYTFITDEFNDSFMEGIMSRANMTRIGELLDELRPSKLIGNQINNLLAQVFEIVMEEAELGDIEGLEATINQIILNIKGAPDTMKFKTELAYLGDFMSVFEEMGDSYELDLLGDALDKLDGSLLINREMINDIVISFIDIVVGEGENVPTAVITAIKQSVPSVVKFKTEFIYLNEFITEFTEILDGEFSEINFEELGETLDSYDTVNGETPSVLISQARPQILIYVYEMLADEVNNETFNTLVQDVKDNAMSVTSYKSEFMHLESLIEMLQDLNDLTLVQIGQNLDVLKTSDVIYNVGNLMFDKIITEIIEETDDETILQVLSNLKQNAILQLNSNTTTFEEIFTALSDLENEAGIVENLDETFNPEDVGNSLNKLQAHSIIGLENSRILANLAIDNLISDLNSKLAEETNPVIIQTIESKILEISNIKATLNAETENVNYLTIFEEIKLTMEY